MKEAMCLLCVIMLSTIVISQESRSIRKSIIPLHSTRLDVGKIATPIEDIGNNRYETKNETIEVNYSKMPCIGTGWNVKFDTVVDYMVYPKTPITINTAEGSFRALVRTSDDAGYIYYTDIQNGIQYVVDSEMHIRYIRYTPSEKDSKYRCKGFPNYNPASETYRPYDSYKLDGTEWDLIRLDGFLIEVKESIKLKGYIFVYCQTGEPITKINQIIKKLRTFVLEERKISPQKVEIIFAGCRDEAEIEMFLIPNEYPIPISSPKYPK
jgi:hypothetical protein